MQNNTSLTFSQCKGYIEDIENSEIMEHMKVWKDKHYMCVIVDMDTEDTEVKD